MARPALSATRGVAIMDFLAANSNDAFTLTEIASAVDINTASCHAIVNALTKGGYLSRLPGSKSYTLGPVLVAAGIAAQRRHPILAIAHSEGKRLAEELDIAVHVTARIGDEILTIDTMPSSTGRTPTMLTGQRRPMTPPVGALFLAWSPEAEVDEWLTHAPSWADEKNIADWREELARIRKNGYQVRVWNSDPDTFVRYMEKYHSLKNDEYDSNLITNSAELPDFQAYAAPVIRPDEYYEVILICAPIFDANGELIFVLNLTDFDEQIRGDRISDYADRLVKTCFKITHSPQLQYGRRKGGTA